MRKLLQVLLLLSVAGVASADDLSDASQCAAKKDFTRAMQIYTRLAQVGNVEAQEQLAEMYWYGDGTTPDEKTAETWFKKAADSGQKKAQQFMQLIAQRRSRSAEIAYYADQFDGGDVKFSNFHCVKPAIPEVSKSNEEIKQVTASINVWLACYNAFVTHLNGVLPAGKAIPKDLGNIMNDQEMGRAMNLMDKTYSAIATDANSQTQAILKKQEEWKKATEVYVAGVNEKIRRENEILQREMDAKMATRGENRRDPTGPGVPSKR